MPDYRIVHAGDGLDVAQSMVYSFSASKYNLLVQLCNVRRKIPTTSSHSSSSSSSSTKVAADTKAAADTKFAVDTKSVADKKPAVDTKAAADTKAVADGSSDVSVLIVTPSMMRYLDGIITLGEDRTHLLSLMRTSRPAVSVRSYVNVPSFEDKIKAIFNDTEFTWRHLEITESKNSFPRCMVELLSMSKYCSEEIPLPMLKKYYLLPEKPVMAKDTVYILVEKDLFESTKVQTLNVVFKDGSKLIATKIADCLYEFNVPDCSESSQLMEVLTNEGESLGTHTIKYRDKLKIFADILKEMLSLAKSQVPQTKEEDNEPVKADLLISDEKVSSDGDIHKLLSHWPKSVKSEKADMDLALPLFAYLFPKGNLGTVVQPLPPQLKQVDEANISFKDESIEEDQETDRSSEILEVKDEDDATSLSAAEEDYVYSEDLVESQDRADDAAGEDYVCSEDLVESREHNDAPAEEDYVYSEDLVEIRNHADDPAEEDYVCGEDLVEIRNHADDPAEEDYVYGDDLVESRNHHEDPAGEEDYVYGENLIETRYHNACQNKAQRTKVTVSAVIPRTTQHCCDRENVSKSCPPDCSKHRQKAEDEEKTYYENSSFCKGMKARTCTNTSKDKRVRKDSINRQTETYERSTSLSETQESSTEVVYEIPTDDAEEIILLLDCSSEDVRPDLPPRHRKNKLRQNSESSIQSLHRQSLSSFAGTTPPSFLMSSSTLSLTKQNSPVSMTKQNSALTKQNSALSLTRQNSALSLTKQNSALSMTRQNSIVSLTKQNLYGQPMVDSLCGMIPRKSPPILTSSTLSLPGLCRHARAEFSNRSTPVTSPDDLVVNNRLPPIPYSIRPSPPIPKPGFQRLAHSYSTSDCFSLNMRSNTVGSRRHRNSSSDEKHYSQENASDDSFADYSEPVEAYLNDVNGLLRSDSFPEQDEVIYERIDEFVEHSEDKATVEAPLEASGEEEPIYDVPRKGIHKSISIDIAPASPRSSVPSSPITPDPPSSHKKSSPWSSFKLSLRKPGKSKRLNTKL